MSVYESAQGVLALADNGLPSASLAAVREEIDQTINNIMGMVGETQNDFIQGAYHQLNTAKEDLDRARAAVEGCRESLRSYGQWILAGG
jgi:hypothetical protein